MWTSRRILALVCVLGLAVAPAACDLLPGEAAALDQIRIDHPELLITQPGSVGSPWVGDPVTQPCDLPWRGIVCTIPGPGPEHVVTGLFLDSTMVFSSSFNHSLPDLTPFTSLVQIEWQDLALQAPFDASLLPTSLQIISMPRCQLHGPLPDLTTFVNLVTITLRDNELSGRFPLSILSLPALNTVDISSNRFYGPVPTQTELETSPLILNNDGIPDFLNALYNRFTCTGLVESDYLSGVFKPDDYCCGDARLSDAEACDDGGNAPNDGCDEFCNLEPDWEVEGGTCCQSLSLVACMPTPEYDRRPHCLDGVCPPDPLVGTETRCTPECAGAFQLRLSELGVCVAGSGWAWMATAVVVLIMVERYTQAAFTARTALWLKRREQEGVSSVEEPALTLKQFSLEHPSLTAFSGYALWRFVGGVVVILAFALIRFVSGTRPYLLYPVSRPAFVYPISVAPLVLLPVVDVVLRVRSVLAGYPLQAFWLAPIGIILAFPVISGGYDVSPSIEVMRLTEAKALIAALDFFMLVPMLLFQLVTFLWSLIRFKYQRRTALTRSKLGHEAVALLLALVAGVTLTAFSVSKLALVSSSFGLPSLTPTTPAEMQVVFDAIGAQEGQNGSRWNDRVFTAHNDIIQFAVRQTHSSYLGPPSSIAPVIYEDEAWVTLTPYLGFPLHSDASFLPGCVSTLEGTLASHPELNFPGLNPAARCKGPDTLRQWGPAYFETSGGVSVQQYLDCFLDLNLCGSQDINEWVRTEYQSFTWSVQSIDYPSDLWPDHMSASWTNASAARVDLLFVVEPVDTPGVNQTLILPAVPMIWCADEAAFGVSLDNCFLLNELCITLEKDDAGVYSLALDDPTDPLSAGCSHVPQTRLLTPGMDVESLRINFPSYLMNPRLDSLPSVSNLPPIRTYDFLLTHFGLSEMPVGTYVSAHEVLVGGGAEVTGESFYTHPDPPNTFDSKDFTSYTGWEFNTYLRGLSLGWFTPLGMQQLMGLLRSFFQWGGQAVGTSGGGICIPGTSTKSCLSRMLPAISTPTFSVKLADDPSVVAARALRGAPIRWGPSRFLAELMKENIFYVLGAVIGVYLVITYARRMWFFFHQIPATSQLDDAMFKMRVDITLFRGGQAALKKKAFGAAASRVAILAAISVATKVDGGMWEQITKRLKLFNRWVVKRARKGFKQQKEAEEVNEPSSSRLSAAVEDRLGAQIDRVTDVFLRLGAYAAGFAFSLLGEVVRIVFTLSVLATAYRSVLPFDGDVLVEILATFPTYRVPLIDQLTSLLAWGVSTLGGLLPELVFTLPTWLPSWPGCQSPVIIYDLLVVTASFLLIRFLIVNDLTLFITSGLDYILPLGAKSRPRPEESLEAFKDRLIEEKYSKPLLRSFVSQRGVKKFVNSNLFYLQQIVVFIFLNQLNQARQRSLLLQHLVSSSLSFSKPAPACGPVDYAISMGLNLSLAPGLPIFFYVWFVFTVRGRNAWPKFLVVVKAWKADVYHCLALLFEVFDLVVGSVVSICLMALGIWPKYMQAGFHVGQRASQFAMTSYGGGVPEGWLGELGGQPVGAVLSETAKASSIVVLALPGGALFAKAIQYSNYSPPWTFGAGEGSDLDPQLNRVVMWVVYMASLALESVLVASPSQGWLLWPILGLGMVAVVSPDVIKVVWWWVERRKKGQGGESRETEGEEMLVKGGEEEPSAPPREEEEGKEVPSAPVGDEVEDQQLLAVEDVEDEKPAVPGADEEEEEDTQSFV